MKRTALRRKAPLETDIQAAICDYLALRKHFFWRQNTGGMYREGRFFSLPKHSMRGVPDILLIRKEGYFVGLEVKNEKGRMSPEQLTFAAHCKRVGAEYYVVRSVEDVQQLGL